MIAFARQSVYILEFARDAEWFRRECASLRPMKRNHRRASARIPSVCRRLAFFTAFPSFFVAEHESPFGDLKSGNGTNYLPLMRP